MGRTALLTILLLLSLALTCSSTPAAMVRPSGGAPVFPTRMVKIGGSPGDPAVREHLRFCRELGFNAVWVYSHDAGRWWGANNVPRLDPDFLEVARWCRRQGMRIVVSVNPVTDSGHDFVFSEAEGERRLLAFLRLLREEAGVRDFVLSFDDLPTRLTSLPDLMRYGVSTAPAHLDLTGRIARALTRRDRLWLCASAYCDDHLGDGSGPYSSPFLAGLGALPRRVGIVWTGPSVISHTIRTADLSATRARLGGRELLLYDNYPVNDNYPGDALALVLAPLRLREAGLAGEASAYLSCPMRELGASRLALRTVADYLRDPLAYDADASWRRAQVAIAGAGREAREALDTQCLEWGGWVRERNWRHRDVDNALLAAERLVEPAVVASWEWVVRRYPERMAALAGLEDHAFREEMLPAMAARLAVARAAPLAKRWLQGHAAEVAPALRALRASVSAEPKSARTLDLFFEAAGIDLSEPAANLLIPRRSA